jgi:hypothetical protein
MFNKKKRSVQNQLFYNEDDNRHILIKIFFPYIFKKNDS